MEEIYRHNRCWRPLRHRGPARTHHRLHTLRKLRPGGRPGGKRPGSPQSRPEGTPLGNPQRPEIHHKVGRQSQGLQILGLRADLQGFLVEMTKLRFRGSVDFLEQVLLWQGPRGAEGEASLVRKFWNGGPEYWISKTQIQHIDSGFRITQRSICPGRNAAIFGWCENLCQNVCVPPNSNRRGQGDLALARTMHTRVRDLGCGEGEFEGGPPCP